VGTAQEKLGVGLGWVITYDWQEREKQTLDVDHGVN